MNSAKTKTTLLIALSAVFLLSIFTVLCSCSGQNQNQQKTYDSIYQEYDQKMKDELPTLKTEFTNEASGIKDVNQLATLSNAKISKLAETCNAGGQEMASLMTTNGDSYDTYQSNYNKLYSAYQSYASELTSLYQSTAQNLFKI